MSTFGAQAGECRAFRPAWPAGVFARIVARVPRPRRRALDLGAGTGLVATRLVEHFQEVVELVTAGNAFGGGHARSLPDPEDYWRELEARVRACAGPGPHVLFHVELFVSTKPATRA